MDSGLSVDPFTAEQAEVAASLRPATAALGLSLGDRACLALAVQHHVPAVSADQLWGRIDIGVEVRLLR